MISTFGRSGRKLMVAAVAATLGLASVAALVPDVAGAAQSVTQNRYAGTNRYGTSAAVAAAAFPTGSNNIIVASGENYPDGLAAATLAGAIGGPVLLTATGSLSQETSNAIGSIDGGAAGPGTIWVVGGTAAVSTNVRNQIKALGYSGSNFKEIGGATRYETAASVAASAAAVQANVAYNGLRTAIIASGQNFPDALSAGPVAYINKMPILLTQTASLNASTKKALTDRSIQQVLIMGGTAAVSQATSDAIAAMGITVVRVAGVDRFDTAYQLATLESKAAGLGGFGFDDAGTPALDPDGVGTPAPGDAGVDQVVLASGLNFPDALSASPLAGIRKAPILLMASAPAKTTQFGNEHNTTLNGVSATGGTGVISNADLQTVADSMTGKTPTATITANQGSNSFKVVFSEDVSAGQVAASYLRNNAALPGGTSVAYNSVLKTATVTMPFGSNLAAGDSITVSPTASKICTAEATPRCVAPTTTTVAADTTKPTATLKAFTGSSQVWAIFSEPVTTSGAAGTTFNPGDITSNTGAGDTFVAVSPSVFKVHITAPATAGQAFTLDTTWTDLAGNAPTANTQTTAVTDTAAPSLASANNFTIPFLQAAKVLDGAGGVTITAKKGAGADGAAGNAWTITTADNNAPVSISVDSTNKVVTINSDMDDSAGQESSRIQIVNALTSNSTFAGLFTATQTGGGGFNPGATSGKLTGGLTLFAEIVNFNEGVDGTSVQNGDFALDLNGDGIAEADPTTGIAPVDVSNAHNNTVVVTFFSGTAGLAVTPGTSRVIVGSAITDLAQNTIVFPTSVVIS